MAFYLLPSLLLLMAKASAQPNFISHFCIYNTGNFTANSTFKANLDHVLSSITTNKSLSYGFYRFSYGQSSDIANAVGLCRPDITPDACQSCLMDSVCLLGKHCSNQKEAIGWYENCSLHYSSTSLSNQMYISPMFRTQSTKNATNTDQFIRRLRILLNSLKNKASLGGPLHKYATGNMSSSELETTHALVQCLPDLTPRQCDDCLSSSFKKLPSFSSQSAGIFTPSCMVNYKPNRFFDSVTDDGPTPPLTAISTPSSTVHESRAVGKKNVKNRVHIVIIMVLSVVSCWVLIICIYMFLKSRKIEERVESN
ncbi:cysteine-rich receptor-like protein kinase 26 [Benincasa hispida]|uniref:cysteine-rich receptor-like protein kinase 26 n=1 Tax=Benincasa hispida TaxID=102211 RepID=UPI0018FFDF8B|nr:cysteine-rich receptor-like protein kinase 26 [Benincasa hispida]